ncbi:MAG: hypothetical protein RMJ56_12170 [Gemmataceae bacterium]|nr:hypothetical protein [Gemmata sp.]MDW8198348.1 hypothetical protein [Gemmataceae bacterium]
MRMFGWALVLLSGLGLSCSPSGENYHPVKGKVLYKDEPLAGALVTFHPKGRTDLKTVVSTALTQDDGTFSAQTGDKAGMPTGDYVVTIICSETVKPKAGVITTGPPETRDRLNGAYADKEKSTIRVTIKAGENQLEPFHLK